MINWMLALHYAAFAMGTGMSLANLVNFRLARHLPPEQTAALAALRRMMGRLGDGVIALIWLSGIVVLRNFTGGESATALPLTFHVKMVFVTVLTLCHIGARLSALRAARSPSPRWTRIAEACTAGVFTSALASIILAVATFSS
jgi:hypothetical protein